MDDLQEIKEQLERILSLLQRLPELQAAVFLQLNEEYQSARMSGRTAEDLWTINPPEKR